MTSIAENYEIIRERMGKACAAAGRKTESVALEAVSKYVDVPRLQDAMDLGIRLYGENHAQELTQKKTFFENNEAEVHFIGQLQTNKIKYVCGNVGVVESMDRPALMEALDKRAEQLGICQNVLIQVNIGDEPQKGGILPEELDEFSSRVWERKNLRLRGLMCVPPALEPEETRPYFARMYRLFEQLKMRFPALPIDTLSMGMSHDYDVAIMEGATVVRIGTALFGARDKK
jgi:pyridoxal phosphate enzyme (YggS family)